MLIETLESRRLLSSTVIETYPGVYEVYGDENPNDISLSVSMGGESFVLDGNAYFGVATIYVDGGGGDDTISVISVDGAGSIGAGVNGGDGNDIVSLNFDGAVRTGVGDDIIYLTDSFYGEADGDEGNDQIYIIGETVDARIIGGNGDDFIDCRQSRYGVVVRAGNGNDTVYGSSFDDVIYGGPGNDVLHGYGGNDAFYTGPGEDDFVDGGEGYDVIYLMGGSDFTNVNIESYE